MFDIEKGHPWPLGAHADARGVNFAVFSAHADRIELCLFDASGVHEQQRLNLPGRSRDVFHGFVPGLAPGCVYGLRAHGPWQPEQGHRFNPHKLLLDPCTRETIGRFEWRAEQFGGDQHTQDNAAWALKARVALPVEVTKDTHLYTPIERSVIYEMHVKGFTARHPHIPEPLRGTYAGLAHEAALDHLTQLLGLQHAHFFLP
jgi:pullulanase/glycogen debranching enzyme